MNQKTNKYTLDKLEQRKTPNIGDSSNNDRAGARKFSIKKVFSESFIKNLCWSLFLNKVSHLL